MIGNVLLLGGIGFTILFFLLGGVAGMINGWREDDSERFAKGFLLAVATAVIGGFLLKVMGV